MSSKRVTATLLLGIALFAVAAYADEQRIGPLDPGAGTVTASFFPEPSDCPGTHDVSVWFLPYTVMPQFAPVQWLGVPSTATLAPDAAFLDVTIPLDKMAAGTYTGAIVYKCERCSEGHCAGTARISVVSVEVAAPAVFGAAPADRNFGGLVNGQPVSVHDLTINVIGDIKKSSFMQLTPAAAVIQELEDHYLDRNLHNNNLSDVSFVKTTGSTDKNGRMKSQIEPVDEESVVPGNARYTRQEDRIAGVVEDEEIYVGVDVSLQGITAARRNPDQYYVFMLDGQMGVVRKSDFVHNLMHEGMHALVSGQYNTPDKNGAMAASLEEEQEGFRVGNAADRALGLPEDTTTPGANYGGGSNPAYRIQFPQLVPGQEATDPTRMQPKAGATPKRVSALPKQGSGTEPGFCRSEGPAFRCDGTPNYALACDAARLGGRACSIEGTGLRAPCSLGETGWECAAMPPAIARCTAVACKGEAVGSACSTEGKQVSCTALPIYGLACETAGPCAFSDPLVSAGSDALADAAKFLYAATQSTDCSRAGSGEIEAVKTLGGGAPASDGRGGGIVQDIATAFARDSGTAPGLPRESFIFMFAPGGTDAPSRFWPGAGGRFAAAGSDALPERGVVEVTRASTGLFTHGGLAYQLQGRSFGSVTVPAWVNGNAPAVDPFVSTRLRIGGTPYTSLLFDEYHRDLAFGALRAAGHGAPAPNPCRSVLVPVDPNYRRTGRNGGNSWGEKRDDQWAIKRVGYTDDETSAWRLVPDTAVPIVVAVIDTGLDWHHADLDPASLWRNDDEIPDNGIDDDRNGYVDDLIGWDFVADSNRPWDEDGHGTLVTGIIAASHNDVGIAGISSNARIMVLKGVNNFGTTRASWLAEAIVYAADNGARIINLSVGGPHESRMEQAALDYARTKGVLVVAAAGNSGVELTDFGPGGHDSVLTVGATHVDDRAAAFSNFGARVDLVAPGVDVLSLRARHTDANYRPWQDDRYKLGDFVVGDDKRYLHASGTSFSTPIVTGTAALVLGKNPRLTASELEAILTQTAIDIEAPGRDPYTGHGMINPRAALTVAPGFAMAAEIARVELLPAGAPTYARVWGTIDATHFKRGWVQIGPGENPGAWRFVGQKRKFPIHDGQLATIPLSEFTSTGPWLVVVNVEDKSGVVKRAASRVQIP